MNNANSGNVKNQSWDFDYLSASQETLFEKLKTSQKGLTDQEVKKRLQEYGLNEPARKKKRTALFQFLSKFANPLVIVLRPTFYLFARNMYGVKDTAVFSRPR